jgi:hypothetical protein
MYEDKIVRLDVDRKKEDGPVVGPIGNISEELANIMTISCGTCHLVRSSGSEKAATPSEFDYLSVDQWKTFVTERNKNEALAYILDNMCPRLSQSVCKTSDTENRKLIEDYIMGLEIE